MDESPGKDRRGGGHSGGWKTPRYKMRRGEREGVGDVEPVLTKNTMSQIVDERNEQKNLRQGTLSVESREC